MACKGSRDNINRIKPNSLIFFIPPRQTKGYFREKSKSQNIDPISPTTKSTSSIIQVETKACQLCSTPCFSVNMLKCKKSIKMYLNVQFRYLSSKSNPRGHGVCKVKCVLAFCSMLHSLGFDMQHDHLQKKKIF